MPRPRDPRITEALHAAVLELLGERPFADVSMDAIAERAGVGKPAIYRRFSSKAELVTSAIAAVLPVMDLDAPQGDVRAHLRRLVDQAAPADPQRYAGLIGGLIAEQHRHPELIAAFRERLLLPRRAIVRAAVERGRREGVVRADLDPEIAVDLLGGAFLARAFAGLPMTAAWRDELFAAWWQVLRAPAETGARRPPRRR